MGGGEEEGRRVGEKERMRFFSFVYEQVVCFCIVFC